MKQNPLVSGVIIFLNAEKYLREAIDSVLAQTYDHWELFLVDDGSTDESEAIARHYANSYPDTIHYLHHENRQNMGKNASRNLGIAHSRGKYIALLDADDVWLPHKLSEQVELLEQNPEAAMLYGRTRQWVSWNGNPDDVQKDSFADLGVTPNRLFSPPQLLYLLLNGETQTPTTCNAILRRTVFDEIGGFDEAYHDIYEDQVFFAKVELTYSVYVADATWANYRQHPESSFTQYLGASKHSFVAKYTTKLKFLDWVERYMRENDHSHEDVWLRLTAKQKANRRIVWLCHAPMIGPIVRMWLHMWIWLLDLTIQVGRRCLPTALRDRLWSVIGKKLVK